MSVQERLQLKREPLDKWSIREQLCLASAVARSGDQNWMSVSRALKPFGEPNRPADWFHQKNCAAQYGMLLGNVETPKRKKRAPTVDIGIETPAENILKKLSAERQVELKKLLAEEKAEYQKLQQDMLFLQSGTVTEEQLDIWCKEIDEEEHQKEQEAIENSRWLKERDQRKQEIERAWRPSKPASVAGQKRKNSDSFDTFLDQEHMEDVQQQQQQQQLLPQTPEPSKPALSPLLTSLLKSPSQVQNASILHTAITTRNVPTTSTNPMIASLLNSTTNVAVSPGLQQLVSTAIGQNQVEQNLMEEHNAPMGTNILDDPSLPNIKLDDLANSILVQDGPLPEIKKEEVDDIISEIIENAQDIVADPEKHFQLDGNGDININLELEDFDEEDIAQAETEFTKQKFDENLPPPPFPETKVVEENTPTSQSTVVDPFEFQEDPVIFEPSTKPSGAIIKHDPKYVPHYNQPQSQQSFSQELCLTDSTKSFEMEEVEENRDIKKEDDILEQNDIKKELEEDEEGHCKGEKIESQVKTENSEGLVEIVEVVVMDDDDTDKELNKSEIQSVVHSSKSDDSEDVKSEKPDSEEEKPKTETEESSTPESKDMATFEESSEASDTMSESKKDANINLDVNQEQDSMETTVTPDFSEELYNEMSMEVKVDKSGTIKRDYSRMKKKEEKDFDVLLAIEKAQLEDSELTEETLSDNTTDTEKKDNVKVKIKSENERSSSPWTEEEDNRSMKRRYSTPATPVDSVPNSPASSNAFYEDDRDYRNWKKSVMLVYNRLATNKYASLFLKPITDEQAPGYSCVVYRPMDLLMIKKNIENGTIRTTLEFKRDVMLMFTNAIMYNKTNGTVYNMASQMQQESLQPIEILMQAIQGDAPFRRETRTSESGVKRKRTLTDELLKAKKRKED